MWKLIKIRSWPLWVYIKEKEVENISEVKVEKTEVCLKHCVETFDLTTKVIIKIIGVVHLL